MPSPKSIAPDALVKHHAVLLRLAQRMVRDRYAAEDVVQDAYVAALRADTPPRPRAWLAGVVRNKAKELLRSRGRRKERHRRVARLEALASTADVAARTEGQRHLAAAISRLEEPGRSAIVLRYFDGISPSAIAERDGVSVRTIESRLRRARKRLAEMLDAVYAAQSARWELVLVPMAGNWTSLATGTSLASSASGAAQAASSGAAAWTAGAHVAAAGTVANIIGGSIVGMKSVIAIAAAVGAIGFFAGSEVQKRSLTTANAVPGPADSDQDPDLMAATNNDEDARNPELEGENEVIQVRRKLARESSLRMEAEVREKQLTEEVAMLKKQVASLGGTRDNDDKKKGVAFAFDRYKGVFARMDWEGAATAYAAMVPLMEEVVKAPKKLQDPIFMQRLMSHNTKLIHVASAAHEAGVPGKDINGAFTHPAIYVNLVDSTLTAGERPLSKEQRLAVSELGDEFLRRIEEFEKSRSKLEYALEARVQESTIKQAFFDSLDAILDAEQVELIHPESIRGICGLDLMSSGLIWQMHVHPLFGSSREALTSRVRLAVKDSLGLDDDGMSNIDGAIGRFVQSLTDEDLQVGPAATANLFRVPRVLSGARATLRFMKDMIASLPADHAAVEKIKVLDHALVLGLRSGSK